MNEVSEFLEYSVAVSFYLESGLLTHSGGHTFESEDDEILYLINMSSRLFDVHCTISVEGG